MLLEFGGNDCDFDWAAIAADPEGSYVSKTPPETFESCYRRAIRLVEESGREPIVLTLPPIHSERYLDFICRDGLKKENILRWLGDVDAIYRWQIAEIPELYFCGNLTVDGKAAVSFDADGTCRVNGAPVIRGQVSDLRLIESMVRLEQLALICQPLDDLSGLNGHLLLRELSLAGSGVDDLSTLTELPSLETLHLEYTGVRDLTPLETLPNLKTVTVSREMLPLTWSEEAAFAVVLIRES